MKVVIVAAGLASRLYPITEYIPKILVNTGKNTALVEQINYWSKYSKDITIVLHSKYEQLVRAYFDMYFSDTNVELTIKTIDVALGSAHTIFNTITSEYYGHEVLFSWCDIIPRSEIDFNAIPSNLVFANGNQHRYKIQIVEGVGSIIKHSKDSTGNVFGMYLIRNFQPFDFEEGQDFIHVIEQFGEYSPYHVDDIDDFGDMRKLINLRHEADKAREFNSLEFVGDFVYKKALNKQGNNIIRKEIEWYQEVHNKNTQVRVPKVYPSLDRKEFLMERINGDSVYVDFPYMDNESQIEVIDKILSELDKLHSCSTDTLPEYVYKDIKKEAYEKLLTRCQEIDGVIQAFGPVLFVNGIKVPDLQKAVTWLFDELIKEHKDYTTEYYLIHGDPQFSNTMMDENGNISFIDPRGYFGDTPQYGIKEYDVAKVLYSLSGYDHFNYAIEFGIEEYSKTDKHLIFTLPDSGLKQDPSQFKRVHYLWLAVIWIGLAQYIKNDPIKSVVAYYHGLWIVEKLMTGGYDVL